MAEKRKDSKGRVLRKGEHERKDGRYHYLYLDASGKRCYVYAKDLISLREMEKEIERDLLDGISTASGKTTLNRIFKMHMELKNDLRATTRAVSLLADRTFISQPTTGRQNLKFPFTRAN